MPTLRDIVFEALDNSVENGYSPGPDDLATATELLDQDSEVAGFFGCGSEYPGENDPRHVKRVMGVIAEWKKERDK